MTLKNLERLIHLLKENGVSYIKTLEVELKLDVPHGTPVPLNKPTPKGMPAQAAPPVQIEIPHHVNEVQQLLKLSDEDLVDRLFPEHNKEVE